MLQIKNINKSFGKKVIFEDTSLYFSKNGLYFLSGENGIGKTTLINIITEQPKKNGVVFELNSKIIEKEDFDNFKSNIGYVSQQQNVMENFSVDDNIKMFNSSISDSRLLEIKKILKITDISQKKGSQLSGGQKQKVLIARCIAKESSLIIMDEPFNNLDNDATADLIEILSKLKKNYPILITSHQNEIFAIVDYQIKIENYKIIQDDAEQSDISNLEFNHKIKFNYSSFIFKNFLQSSKLFFILFSLVACYILFLTISFFNFNSSVISEQYYPPFQENIIVIDKVCPDDADRCRSTYFFNDDIEKFNKIDGVNNVVILSKSPLLSDMSINKENDPDFFYYKIPISDATYLKDSGYITPDFYNEYQYQLFDEQYLKYTVDPYNNHYLPVDIRNETKEWSSQSCYQSGIILGAKPQNFSKEITIPESLAIELGLGDPKNAFGREISILSSKYQIVGVNSEIRNFCFAYNLSPMTDQEKISEYNTMQKSDPALTFDQFNSFGDNISSFYLNILPGSEEQVIKELNDNFESITVSSNTSDKNNHEIEKTAFFIASVIIIFLTITFLFTIFYSIQRLILNYEKQNLKIIYNYGYRKKIIYNINIIESSLLAVISTITFSFIISLLFINSFINNIIGSSTSLLLSFICIYIVILIVKLILTRSIFK